MNERVASSLNSSRSNSVESDFCWQVEEAGAACQTGPPCSPAPGPRAGGVSPKSCASTPSSPRRMMPLARQKSSMASSGSSPLHVAAVISAAARAVLATTAGDGAVVRQDSGKRLFFDKDEVFKVWEPSMITSDVEERKFQQAISSPNRAIKKFSSIDISDAAALRRRALLLSKQAQDALTMSADDVAHAAAEEDLGELESSSSNSAILRRRVSSLQQANDVRRSSGALNAGASDPAAAGIKRVPLADEYSIYKQLGTGRFGFVNLAEHKESGMKIALKFFPRPQIKQAEFIREYNFSRFLSPHPNIIDTFEGIFQAADDSAFFFVQEFCPHASLREAVESAHGGIGEPAAKAIMLKVICAIEFMHGERLVHRNIKAENILIFDPVNFTRVKLADFGLTRKTESVVKHLEYVNCYHAPELCETVVKEMLTISRAIDIWALGVLFFFALRGRFPWQKATIMCKPYWEWDQWLKHKLPNLPKYYENYTEKGLKLLKSCLNPRPKDRWLVKELKKFVEKEKLIKCKATYDDSVYYPDGERPANDRTPREESGQEAPANSAAAPKQKKSTIHRLINQTMNTMSEISEQVVSARDDE